MSNPARFPDRGHSRHRSSGSFPVSRPWSSTTPQWGAWGAPLPNSGSMDASVHPALLHQTTDLGNRNPTPSAWGPLTPHSTRLAGMPHEPRLRASTSARPTPQLNRWTNSSDGLQVDTNRNYPPLENLSRHLEYQQKRLKWREVLLSGEPQKALKDSLSEASRLVVTFITRGSPKLPHGQGTELLRFRPPKRASHFPKAQDWTYFAMDTSLLIKNKKDGAISSAVELSKKPFAYLLPKLDVKKDLKLVRKSKPLLWDNSTVLESFLYRIVEKKEDPESAGGKDLAQRLGGPALHSWYQTSEIQSLLMSTDSELICTALNAVFFPPRLSEAIDKMSADQKSPSEQLTLRALEALYICVQLKHARMAFKFYPIPPPPSDQPEHALCDKRRVWAYWTEVLAWHLSKLREDSQVSTSYALLKSLSAVKDSVHDPKVTLDELESIMISAIATEADRSSYATDTLIDEAACECLHNPSFSSSEKPLGMMHIITAGDSPIVSNVIAKLITHVLASKISPTESSPRSTVKGEISDLKIIIAEGRPLSKGVVLATKLAGVVDSYMERKDRTFKPERHGDTMLSPENLENSFLNLDIRSRLNKAVSEEEWVDSKTKLPLPTLGLSHLLADLDAKKDRKVPKVTIEVITDAAVVSKIVASRDCGIKPIILLSADCIHPNGNSVNAVGGAQMAWAGKLGGGVVLILCRADRVHPKGLPVPSKQKNPINQLKTSWKATIPEEFLRPLHSSSHVKISNPTHEQIDHKFITGYITELGLMQISMLKEFSNMRCDLQKAIWPVNELTK